MKRLLILAIVATLIGCSPTGSSQTSTTTTVIDVTTTTVTVPEVTTTTTTLPEWETIFEDQFDEPNNSNWRLYHNTYGDGNNELACLTPDNVSMGDGLKITAQEETRTCPNGSTREYTSGFLGSRDVGRYYPAFARFEMRAKLPHGQGLWPAFWLRHRNGASVAEVDIMEYFHAEQPGMTRASLHFDGEYNRFKTAVNFESVDESEWHVWGVTIDKIEEGVKFTFDLDGVVYGEYIPTDLNWLTRAPLEETWDIAINLAVGGDWIGHPRDSLGYLRGVDRCAQGGVKPDRCNAVNILRWDGSPAVYEVDYVKVLRRTGS